VAVVTQRDKEQCAAACRNHTRFTVLSVVIVTRSCIIEYRKTTLSIIIVRVLKYTIWSGYGAVSIKTYA
jgi:hypothetical protein